jgi:hypothetical protein
MMGPRWGFDGRYSFSQLTNNHPRLKSQRHVTTIITERNAIDFIVGEPNCFIDYPFNICLLPTLKASRN